MHASDLFLSHHPLSSSSVEGGVQEQVTKADVEINALVELEGSSTSALDVIQKTLAAMERDLEEAIKLSTEKMDREKELDQLANHIAELEERIGRRPVEAFTCGKSGSPPFFIVSSCIHLTTSFQLSCRKRIKQGQGGLDPTSE